MADNNEATPTFRLSDRFDYAFCFASKLHRDQKRKNLPVPFLCHLLSVSALVIENISFITDDPEACEDFVMTAILHDTVEDQGGNATYEKLKAEFGTKIADYVLMLSDSIPVNGIKPPKAERNEAYKRKMLSEDTPLGIVLVSCCDKIHNLRSMQADALVLGSDMNGIWKAYTASPADTVANYEALLNIYKKRLGARRVIALYEQALQAIKALMPKEG